MPSQLVKPEAELSPESLLVLCDLATTTTGRRRDERIWTLLGASCNRRQGGPLAVKTLEAAGLVEMRSKTGSWDVEITDRGLTLHRCLVAALRNSSALVGGATPAPTEPAKAGTTNRLPATKARSHSASLERGIAGAARAMKATGNHALASAATH